MEDYRNQRRMQVRLAIKPHGYWVNVAIRLVYTQECYLQCVFVFQKGEINDYKKFFYGIVGLVQMLLPIV